MSRFAERLWWRRDEPLLARAALSPLLLAALGYRAGAVLARAGARPVGVAAPVISVGNLCVGGAGKTPLALLVCQRLLARGERPALLSRGYGGSARGVSVVSTGAGPLLDARAAGDEPVLLAQRCPGLLVLAGPRRALLAEEALRRGATVLVLDDGLQHHALARDLDLIALDAQNLLGNGHLLPRGPLRELPASLARVGARGLLVLTSAGPQASRDPRLPALLADLRALGLRGPVETEAIAADPTLRGARVLLLAGIARPERFAQTVRGLGADVAGCAFFADHHVFTAGELAAVRTRAAALGAARIVCTEKDFVRLAPAERAGLVPLPISLRVVSGEDALAAALDAALGAGRARAGSKP